MTQLWAIGANPRRRKARKSRKHRSPAQRAATRRMIAANRSRFGIRANPRRRSRRVRRNPVAAMSHHRRVARRASSGFRGMGSGAMGLVKAGAVGAGGALTVDIAMGFVNGFLPATMSTKLNADGSPNYVNYAAKGALAVALAHFGRRLVGPGIAHTMAAGSFTVMAYELLRPMVQNILPGSLTLGYYANMPGTRMTPANMGRLGLANYQQIPGNAGGSGTVAMLRSPNAAGRR